MPFLQIQNGEEAPQRHALLLPTTLIGRHPDCQIVISDASVSSRHAEVIVDGEKVILRDLQTVNGTTVNGAPITESVLSDGDEIHIGPVVCWFENAPVEIAKEQSSSSLGEDVSAPTKPASFGANLAAFGKAAFGEAKRGAQIATTKAKIEKLKWVELNKAFYELGKRAHELHLHKDLLTTAHEEISDLEQRIKTKRDGTAQAEEETTGGMVKRVAGNAKSAAEAEALNIKLKQLVTDLGKQVSELSPRLPDLQKEHDEVAKVTAEIEKLEAEMLALREDASGSSQLKSLTSSMTTEAGAKTKVAMGKIIPLAKSYPKASAAVALFIVALVIAGGFHARRGKTEATLGHGGSLDEEIADVLPFEFSRIERGLLATGFKFTGADFAESREKAVSVRFTRANDKLTAIEIRRMSHMKNGQMDDFHSSDQAFSDAASSTVGVFLPKEEWQQIANWHYKPVGSGLWYQQKDIVGRSKAQNGFLVQSLWQHQKTDGDERVSETMSFIGIPRVSDPQQPSKSAQAKEVRATKF